MFIYKFIDRINSNRRKMSKNFLRNLVYSGIVNEYLNKYNVEYVLNEFTNSLNEKQSWSPLIDDNMYEKALNEFIKYSSFPYFPTKYIYSWVGIIMKNTAILLSNTILYGKGNYFPVKECENWINEVKKNSIKLNTLLECFQILRDLGLYKWMKLEDGSTGFTDFGLKELLDILNTYSEDMSPEDVFVLVNLCLNVTHFRGDLSSIFIKGGKKTLDKFK